MRHSRRTRRGAPGTPKDYVSAPDLWPTRNSPLSINGLPLSYRQPPSALSRPHHWPTYEYQPHGAARWYPIRARLAESSALKYSHQFHFSPIIRSHKNIPAKKSNRSKKGSKSRWIRMKNPSIHFVEALVALIGEWVREIKKRILHSNSLSYDIIIHSSLFTSGRAGTAWVELPTQPTQLTNDESGLNLVVITRSFDIFSPACSLRSPYIFGIEYCEFSSLSRRMIEEG